MPDRPLGFGRRSTEDGPPADGVLAPPVPGAPD